MTDGTVSLVSAAKLAHLRGVARKELTHLLETTQRLVAADPQFEWLDRAEQHPLLTERLDAFVARFGRLQDTLGDKLLPLHLQSLAENLGSVIDNLNRAERLAIVPNVQDWLEARALRNKLVHEYSDDMQVLRASLQRAIELVPTLQAVTLSLSPAATESSAQ